MIVLVYRKNNRNKPRQTLMLISNDFQRKNIRRWNQRQHGHTATNMLQSEKEIEQPITVSDLTSTNLY